MERTQRFLDDNHISQTELASALGVTGATINRKIRGVRKWSLGEVHAALSFFSRRLGRPVSFDEVFGTDDMVAGGSVEAEC